MIIRARSLDANRKLESATCLCLQQAVAKVHAELQDLCTPCLIITDIRLYLQVSVHFKQL